MSMFDYMKNKFKKTAADATDATDATQDAEALLKERIKKLVYDEEVADKLLPIFSKLQDDEYTPLWELLEAKESIIGSEFFKQESQPAPVQSEPETEESVLTAEDILRERFSA